MPQTRTTWFCVADAGGARVLEALAPRAALTEVGKLAHEIYEHGRYEEPGKSQESATSAHRSGSAPASPAPSSRSWRQTTHPRPRRATARPLPVPRGCEFLSPEPTGPTLLPQDHGSRGLHDQEGLK